MNQIGIKSKFAAVEANALTARPSDHLAISNSSDWKKPLARSWKFWKHVLVQLGDDSVVKCKYCLAKFTESKQKQLTILSGSQKNRFSGYCSCKIVGCRVIANVQDWEKARRVKMVGFQGLKIPI